MTNDARINKIKDSWRHGGNYVTRETLNPVLGGIVSELLRMWKMGELGSMNLN